MNLSKVAKFFTKDTDNQEKLLILLMIIFFGIYSIIVIKNIGMFNSPDESANYFFSTLFNQTSTFTYDTKTGTDIVHPRSMTVSSNNIVPQSFLGLPLIYGLISKIFSTSIIIFLTPLIAIISVWFFYQIVEMVFKKKIALISSLLLLVHPAFVYYSSRSMFHNILFYSLFVIGLYFLVVKKINYQNVFLASLFISLSLIVRTSEAPWVFLILAILYTFNAKAINIKKIILAGVVGLCVLSPILYFNNILYGHPLASGYSTISLESEMITPIKSTHSRSTIENIAINWWNYSISIFWWLSIPMYLGLIHLTKNFKSLSKNEKTYLLMFFSGFIYLIIYYGSWVFNDNPDPTKITIGTSYVRYWLPIHIFSLPFLSIILIMLSDGLKNKKHRKVVAPMLIIFIIGYSLIYTFFTSDEALAKNTLDNYREIKSKVLNLTENDSIIIAGYYDKIFFPERMVIENIDEERTKRLIGISNLINNNRTVYYYSWQTDTDIEYLNEKVLNKYGLKIVEPVTIETSQRLFKVIKE